MNKPIRILQIGMHDKIGGVETYLMNYYRNIDKSKIQFDFINPYTRLCFEDEIKALGGKIYRVANMKKNPLKYYRKIKKIIKENKYEIVHINLLSLANVLPILAAKNGGAQKIILHSHNASTPHGLLRKMLNKINKKIALRNSTNLFACSELAGRWMFGGDKDFTLINNAIDLDRFRYNENKRMKIRRKLNIEYKFVIGHIGRFSEQKNHIFLVEIFSEVVKKNDNVVLLLIGDGELKPKIKEKVKALNIERNVIFMNPVSNPEDYYQAMDIFILPSLFEGLPVVGIEVQASGTNCIFSNKITNELNLTEFCKFIDLNDKKETWCKYILNSNFKKNAIDNTKLIENYDIKKESKKIEDIYIKLEKDCQKKPKIMHLVYGLGNGGVETVLYNYFSKINNYELVLAAQNVTSKETMSKFEDIGFKIYELPEKKKGIIKYCKELSKIIKIEKPNIIHCHMTMGNFLPNMVAYFKGIKIRISHSHFAYAPQNIKTIIYRKLGNLFSNKYMACSVDAAHYLFGKRIGKVYILKNAINLEKFEFSNITRQTVRKNLNIENHFVIGNVGRFIEQKNHNFLIDIFHEIVKIRKDSVLLLIGDGDLEWEIKEKVKKTGINDKVIFLGSRNDVNELMMAMDLFLFPTLFEGLGIVLLEAQLSGLSCVCSNRLPQDVRITNNITFLDLNENINDWVNECVKEKKINRNSIDLSLFTKAGYNIENESKQLKQYYDNLLKGDKKYEKTN